MSLGCELPFALLKLELWRCWREHCGCYYAGHFVDGDEGDGFCCRPDFETDSSRLSVLSWRSVLCRLHHKFSRGVGRGFFPGIVPLRLKQFSNRWPGFLQCERLTTAEGVDVTTTADSRPFAFREGPFRIDSSICVHITHCYHSSVEYQVIICFGAVFYLHVVVVLTFTRIIKSAVTGQAPVTLELSAGIHP